MHNRSLVRLAAIALAGLALMASPGFAQKKYDPGASDTEIKIGNITPYSGPASSYGAIGATGEAYFRMINDQGGINGRKINFTSYDDSYSPPKAVEQTHKLVESGNVLLIFNSVGTPSNTAIQKYLNAKRVPQLFVASGAMLLSGITVNTSPSDFYPIKQMQMMRFEGDRWEMFGPVISSDING
ncbi:hypothetical protein GCM10010994_52540 [Chelatococcus reniformis]|uniref:Leucine-binding protein domain-containing protein n=1 Tax=Chelatococcus reniformis TaxID=1494448 RepID=A0A916XNR8_9HYPH|nr:hypothetical protein GCM10010994_52540 [Chelatococcus reniformis]